MPFIPCSLPEMRAFLMDRDERKHISRLNEWENAGNPRIAIRSSEGFRAGEDLILIHHMVFNGAAVYFEIKEEAHFDELRELILHRTTEEEVLLSSDNEEVLRSEALCARFGAHPFKGYEQYGRFRPITAEESCPDPCVRLLGEGDLAAAESFPDDPDCPYLKQALSWFVENPPSDFFHERFYGYFEDGALLGYLHANSFDDRYWDIGYIFTAEAARNRGIATRMARRYAADIAQKGGFASYGSAANEYSKKTALAAGFERFEQTWSTEWFRKEAIPKR